MHHAARTFSRRSIRFRMTAWYTLLLALVLLTVGFALSLLLARVLRDDVDQQIFSTARDVYHQIQVQPAYPDFSQVAVPPPSALSSLGSADQYIQIVGIDPQDNVTNYVASSSSNLGNDVLPAASIARNDQDIVYRTTSLDGMEIRTIRVPIIYQGRTIGAVDVGESLSTLNRTLNLLRLLLIPVSVIGLGLAALGGWLLAGRALRPVDRITATAAKIGAESPGASLSTRLPVPNTEDEVARLAATFNAMLDRIETAFTAQQRFVADASHELRTPLTAIRGNVEVLMRQAQAHHFGANGLHGDDAAAALDDIARESARMGRLIDGLLLLARSDAPSAANQRPTAPVRLDLVAQEAIRTAGALAAGQTIALDAPSPLVVAGDHDRLVQVVLILLENAIRHTPRDGRITVAVAPIGLDLARLSVTDTGEGIAPEHLPHLFERFYRIDTARTRATGGSGLGLAIADAIVRAHGGTIEVASTPGAGSTFSLTLPTLSDVGAVDAPPPNVRYLRPGASQTPRVGDASHVP